MKEYKLYNWYAVFFVTMLLVSNIIASKMVLIGGFLFPAAVFLFPITYIFGDVLTEVYGYERTRKIIWMGFFCNILMSLVFMLVVYLPYPDFYKDGQFAFSTTLAVVPRIVVASLIGYWCGSFVNSLVMSKMKITQRKKDTKDKYLFLRTILSTVFGEGIDTVLFITIAFLGTIPNNIVIQIVITQYIAKCIIEVVMTPVTYFVVNKTKKVENEDCIGAKSYNPIIIS